MHGRSVCLWDVVADFATLPTVILAVRPEAAVVLTLANDAIFRAVAICLIAFAGDAAETFSHIGNVPPRGGKREGLNRRLGEFGNFADKNFRRVAFHDERIHRVYDFFGEAHVGGEEDDGHPGLGALHLESDVAAIHSGGHVVIEHDGVDLVVREGVQTGRSVGSGEYLVSLALKNDLAYLEADCFVIYAKKCFLGHGNL